MHTLRSENTCVDSMSFNGVTALLSEVSRSCPSPEELPALIASTCELTILEPAVRNGLKSTGSSFLFLFDGLDEGWSTDTLSIGILGGLAITIAGFKDSDLPGTWRGLYPRQYLQIVGRPG